MLNLNSITHLLLSNDHFREAGNEIVSSALYTARKLEQWDIKAPESNNAEASTIFRAFQGLHYSPSTLSARKHLDREFLATMRSFVGRGKYSQPMKASLRALAVLTELDEIISSSDPDQLHEAWAQMQSRQQWMQGGQ
jgi:ataxia telangiectasia mutated family protein